MTDIAALPALMASQGGFIYNGQHIDYWRERALSAESRLTAPPLEEIAGLADQLDDDRLPGCECDGCTVRKKASAVLHQLALENERLKGDLARTRSVYDFAAQEQRIRELEAERDRLNVGWANANKQALKVGLERDANRRKTIEECIHTKVTITRLAIRSDDYLNGFHAGALAKTDSIRALTQSPKDEKTE